MPVCSQLCEGDVLYTVLNFMALLPLEVPVGIVGRYFSRGQKNGVRVEKVRQVHSHRSFKPTWYIRPQLAST